MTFGVIGIMLALLAALGVTLLTYGHSEQQWRDTLRWDQAITDTSEQVTGIEKQRADQALYAATGEPRYRLAFERGARTASAGSRAVRRLGDTQIAAITKRAQAADRRDEAIAQTRLFPAVARNDRVAARSALAAADTLLKAGYVFATQIASRVSGLRAANIRQAKTSARQAKLVGLISLALALLAGIGGTVFVAQAQRRR
ncbi:MAG TPA: hypothetical protein VMU73_09615, partial [Gaiellaceae bacterium]|nr:hypothetical protein [Gaiellaceae bacterium]